jgi:hypothetical protein
MSEVLYNILVESGVPATQVRLIKMCLNEIYSKVGTGKHSSDKFHTQYGLTQGNALLSLLFNVPLEHAVGKIQEKHEELKFIGRH